MEERCGEGGRGGSLPERRERAELAFFYFDEAGGEDAGAVEEG